jgi:hypothetical protein
MVNLAKESKSNYAKTPIRDDMFDDRVWDI